MQRRTLVLTLTLGSLVFAACGSDSNSAVTTMAAPATTAAPGTPEKLAVLELPLAVPHGLHGSWAPA